VCVCVCVGVFEIGSVNYLHGLTLNHDPPDLRLLSSQDYRCESLALGSSQF
jgi:hypothetical protein